ncbi:MAG: GNAT family N-acetyltransferase [Bacteroidetes bacterium]|nr:GNAT family N-acetyltransferase [Bacteroidota bacterium]
MNIVPLVKEHYPKVAQIYAEGLHSGMASFEVHIPDWETWNTKFFEQCRYVVFKENELVAWCALSVVSKRAVYHGVAENTIYVSQKARGLGIGKQLLTHLITKSEEAGFWTLQAGIFTQNKPSIELHKHCGFRIVGTREKIAQRDGIWHDNVLMERRSKLVSYMKNILVLCTGNSCRSQMAHGYLKQMAGNKAAIYSAGIETHGINPGAAATMKKDGIDIMEHTSNHVDEYEGIDWDYIITVCDHAYENCPFIPAPNAIRLHHNFYDPSKFEGSQEDTEAAFAKARDEIKEYCHNFITTHF